MAIQDSDLLLINRAGASYKVAASDLVDKVQSGDLALVNRSGSSYKLTGDKLTAGTFDDTDLFIVNRAGASYQVLGSEIKTLLTPPPPPPLPMIVRAVWSFRSKDSAGSTFRLTIYFGSGNVIDLSYPTEVLLDLNTRGTPLYPIAALEPVTGNSGHTYEALNWRNSVSAGEQTISPTFKRSINMREMYFDLFIPISIVLSGSTVPAINTSLIGSWNGTVGVYQNDQSRTATTDLFLSDPRYFDYPLD